MSNACCRIARKNVSSGDSVMNTGATPSIDTRPSSSARVRS
jgi:hypothetical protein